MKLFFSAVLLSLLLSAASNEAQAAADRHLFGRLFHRHHRHGHHNGGHHGHDGHGHHHHGCGTAAQPQATPAPVPAPAAPAAPPK